jgi:hypothetical protein
MEYFLEPLLSHRNRLHETILSMNWKEARWKLGLVADLARTQGLDLPVPSYECFCKWDEFVRFETEEIESEIRNVFSLFSSLHEVVSELYEFILSCVEVGTAPSTIVESLKIIYPILRFEKIFLVCILSLPLASWNFSSIQLSIETELTHSFSCLCLVIGFVAKYIAPSHLRVSHTLVIRPAPESVCVFEQRLECKLRIIHSLIRDMTERVESVWLEQCLFLSSRYVREGPRVGDTAVLLDRVAKLRFHEKQIRSDRVWVDYEPVLTPDQPITVDDLPPRTRRCCC